MVVVTPITIADFTSTGVYTIGAGGGCLGVHTGLVQFATAEIEELEDVTVDPVGVPWADTPPGVVCFNDLEAKPVDVLDGSGRATPSRRFAPGSDPRRGGGRTGTPDATPQATEVLDVDPSASSSRRRVLTAGTSSTRLGRLGWTPDDIPLVLSGSCTDFTAMEAAGDLVDGIYVTGSVDGLLSPLEDLEGTDLEHARRSTRPRHSSTASVRTTSTRASPRRASRRS